MHHHTIYKQELQFKITDLQRQKLTSTIKTEENNMLDLPEKENKKEMKNDM